MLLLALNDSLLLC